MATTVTETNVLQIQLKAATGDATRTLKVENPQADLTWSEVETALAPALKATATADSDSSVVPFFYDDGDPSAGLTVINEIAYVKMVRSETKLTPATT